MASEAPYSFKGADCRRLVTSSVIGCFAHLGVESVIANLPDPYGARSALFQQRS